jgi:hypothetical protein
MFKCILFINTKLGQSDTELKKVISQARQSNALHDRQQEVRHYETQ